MNIVNRTVLSQLTKILGVQSIKQNNTKVLSHVIGNFYRNQLVFGANTKYLFTSVKNFDALQQQLQANSDSQQSNLRKYLQNLKTVSILEKKGIKSLFPIQIQTFLAVYEGRDILASDRTGSGKTIAYSLPIIEKLRDAGIFKSGKKQVKFLVMCPTRQLCLQVYREISSLKHNLNDYNIVAVYGGAPIDDQIRELRNGVDIIVATPGRLIDLIDRKCINFTELQATCIDEADQMLEKGFKLNIEDIYNIIQTQRKQKTQNLMFSATIPEWVDKISRDFMDNSKKKINLISKSENQTSTTVQHFAVECSNYDRLNCIKSLIKMYNKEEMSTIIFAETKLQVTDIAMQFRQDASFLQGDMSQRQRQLNLDMFRNGKRKLLIATDVASRGLDIDNVGLVIQLGPPRNTEPFIHRAGRTGRAGKKGICITLFDKKKNLQNMLRIEEEAKIKFKHILKPYFEESNQIWVAKLDKIPNQLQSIDSEVLKNPQIQLIADVILSSNADVKQLIKRHLVMLAGEPPVNHSLSNYQPGYKTFFIGIKDPEQKINTLTALNFLKQKFQSLKITNVHVQSSSIIFDVPTRNLEKIQEMLENQQIKESVYEIREANFKDKEMLSLKDLNRENRRQESIFENRNRERFETKSSGYRESRRDDRQNTTFSDEEKTDLFIPGLTEDIEVGDLEEQLKNLNVSYKDIRLKKKSESNIFAFVTLEDSSKIKQLTRKGIYIQGKKLKVFSQFKKDYKY